MIIPGIARIFDHAEYSTSESWSTMKFWSLAYRRDHFTALYGRISGYFLLLIVVDHGIVVEYRDRAIPDGDAWAHLGLPV